MIFLVVSLLSGGGGDGGGIPSELQFGGEGSDLSSECRTGDDANQRQDCRIVAVINSVQAHWKANLEGYRPATTVFFEGGTATGCGNASSAVGLTDTDIRDGLDAAAAVGDDRIQEHVDGRVNPESWTHGSAEQRQRWFTTGYRSGATSPSACDTFTPGTV